MEEGKPFKGKIEEWTIVRVRGYEMVFGFIDGKIDNCIRTSYLVNWDGGLVETRNSIYALGKRAMIPPTDPVQPTERLPKAH